MRKIKSVKINGKNVYVSDTNKIPKGYYDTGGTLSGKKLYSKKKFVYIK